ncbi:MAG: hypothetical protein HEQ23_11895 [Tepidisphaera sp.]
MNLSGDIRLRDARTQAESAAWGALGVTGVENAFSVSP